MSEEEFNTWLNQNRNQLNEIESYYSLDIETKQDLYYVHNAAGGFSTDITRLAKIIEDAKNIFSLDVLDYIEHGHIQYTYSLWVNSQYYGYEGWKKINL